MKLRNLFFASLAMVTFAACSNDNDPLPDPEAQVVDAGDVNINITTKASSPTRANDGDKVQGSDDESRISTLDIYVYVSDGKGNWTYFTEKKLTSPQAAGTNPSEADENNYSVVFQGLKTGTQYKFVAVANVEADAISARPAYSDLKAVTLDYDPTQNFVMSGSQDANGFVTSGAQDAATKNVVTINISRRLAAVQIESLTLNLPDNVPDNFKAAKAIVTDIYLVDMRSQALLGDDEASNLNSEKTDAGFIYGSTYNINNDHPTNNPFGSYNSHLSALNLTEPVKTSLNIELLQPTNNTPQATTTPFGDKIRLYAFPTSKTENNAHYPMLKLRVFYQKSNETEDQAPSQVRYYTIPLKHGDNQAIYNNTLYQIRAAITGLGSAKDDEIEETAGDVTATIQVLAWTVKKQDAGDITD